MKNKRAISLIVLVITIIVLSILAATVIITLSNTNIINQANEAVKNNNEQVLNERKRFEDVEDIAYEASSGLVMERVKDENAGMLEKEDETTFVINSIEDLVAFSWTVTSGTDTYAGKTVKLGNDLDFKSNKSYVEAYRTDYEKYGYGGKLKTLLNAGSGFITIGIATADSKANSFQGTFDGQGHTIYNMYIHVESEHSGKEKCGMFASNFGTIKNLNLDKVSLYLKHINLEKDGFVGGICASNAKTGYIYNCKVTGKIENYSSALVVATGGIAAYSSGIIRNCTNVSNIISVLDNLNTLQVGGICGHSKGSIENSCNVGNIEASGSTVIIGGIAGEPEAEVSNCFNRGCIAGDATENLKLGGIAGWIVACKLYNSYSVGIISTQTESDQIGLLVGYISNDSTIENIYYLKQIGFVGVGKNSSRFVTVVESDMIKSESDMKTKEFVDLLNGQSSTAFVQDVLNTNEGYPVLK